MPFRFLNNVGLGLAVLVFSFGCSDDNQQEGIMDTSSLDDEVPIVKDEDSKVDDKSCTEGEVFDASGVIYKCVDSEWIISSGEENKDNFEMTQGEGTLSELTLNHEGGEREYLLYLPKSFEEESSLPLLLNFHGFGGTMESHMRDSDMQGVADEGNFVLVYPQGTLLDGSPHWNSSLPSPDNKSSTNDFGFVSELIDELGTNYGIDESRVYATGYSNGAFLSYGLACHLSEKIAAVAGVSGTLLDSENCAPKHKTPVMQLHGTADGVVPFEGGNGFGSATGTIDYWVGFNELNDEPQIDTLASEEFTIEHYTYTADNTLAPVELYKIIGGSHVWFNIDFNGTNTNQVIWDFLSKWSIAQ